MSVNLTKRVIPANKLDDTEMRVNSEYRIHKTPWRLTVLQRDRDTDWDQIGKYGWRNKMDPALLFEDGWTEVVDMYVSTHSGALLTAKAIRHSLIMQGITFAGQRLISIPSMLNDCDRHDSNQLLVGYCTNTGLACAMIWVESCDD